MWIDPGTAIIGYGILEYDKGKYEVLDYGCIYTNKEDDMPVRLEKIYDGLDNLIKLWKPDDMAIRKSVFFFKNQKTIIRSGAGKRSNYVGWTKKQAESVQLYATTGENGYSGIW